MDHLSIDRFEGKYAICEDDDRRLFAIELPDLPKGARPGDVLRIVPDVGFELDEEETARRRKRIAEKQKRLFRE